MSSDIRLVICDADHTLANKERMLSERTKAMVARLGEQGILFGIASGRPVEMTILCPASSARRIAASTSGVISFFAFKSVSSISVKRMRVLFAMVFSFIFIPYLWFCAYYKRRWDEAQIELKYFFVCADQAGNFCGGPRRVQVVILQDTLLSKCHSRLVNLLQKCAQSLYFKRSEMFFIHF